MFAKIKNIPDGTITETTFVFMKEMYKEGIFEFSSILTATPEDWKGWWRIVNDPYLSNFVYHASWLEPIDKEK